MHTKNNNLNFKEQILKENPFEIQKVFSGSSIKIENMPSWLPKADFTRQNSDLLAISENGESVQFIDFFTNFDCSGSLFLV